ncbi:unnamed protein product, partial [Polarella glacialis]
DPWFWADEFDSPLLSRGFDVLSQEVLSQQITKRVRSWVSLLPGAEQVQIDVADASRCKCLEAIRIFEKDAERTFVPKDDAQVQERTAVRQQKQVEHLKLVYSEVQDYHQGLGYIVAFLQLFLEAKELAQIAIALHRSEKHCEGYFRSESQAFVRDARVLRKLTEEQLPEVAAHFARFGVIPEMYSVKWFVGLTVHFLPLTQMLDFWEAYFAHGYEWVFAFGLEFFREFRSELLAEESTAGVMTILRMEDPRADWRFPPKLVQQDAVVDRLTRVNLAAIEAIASDSLRADRLGQLREVEAAKVAEEVERARQRMQELADDDDGIVFSDEEEEDDDL